MYVIMEETADELIERIKDANMAVAFANEGSSIPREFLCGVCSEDLHTSIIRTLSRESYEFFQKLQAIKLIAEIPGASNTGHPSVFVVKLLCCPGSEKGTWERSHVCLLPCDHLFHTFCLIDKTRSGTGYSCPACYYPYTENQVVYLNKRQNSCDSESSSSDDDGKQVSTKEVACADDDCNRREALHTELMTILDETNDEEEAKEKKRLKDLYANWNELCEELDERDNILMHLSI